MKLLLGLLILLSTSIAMAQQTVSIRGVNADVDIGTEDVIADGGSRTFAAAAAATTVVSSDVNDDGSPAGTGARTLTVCGLTSTFQHVCETVTLNGTTTVSLSNSLLRVNSMEVATAGSGGVAAGTIDTKHAATVIGSLPIGLNYSQSAHYSRPLNLTQRISRIGCGVSNAVAGSVTFKLLTRKTGEVWIERWSRSVYGAGNASFYDELGTPYSMAAGEDVRLTATATANNSAVECGFDISK